MIKKETISRSPDPLICIHKILEETLHSKK